MHQFHTQFHWNIIGNENLEKWIIWSCGYWRPFNLLCTSCGIRTWLTVSRTIFNSGKKKFVQYWMRSIGEVSSLLFYSQMSLIKLLFPEYLSCEIKLSMSSHTHTHTQTQLYHLAKTKTMDWIMNVAMCDLWDLSIRQARHKVSQGQIYVIRLLSPTTKERWMWPCKTKPLDH